MSEKKVQCDYRECLEKCRHYEPHKKGESCRRGVCDFEKVFVECIPVNKEPKGGGDGY